MKSLVVILAGLWGSCRYTDLYSSDMLFNLMAPLGLVVFVIWLTFWLVVHADLVLRGHSDDAYQVDSVNTQSDEYTRS